MDLTARQVQCGCRWQKKRAGSRPVELFTGRSLRHAVIALPLLQAPRQELATGLRTVLLDERDRFLVELERLVQRAHREL